MINADLLALADRVEKLTGPDRDVDAEIYCVLNEGFIVARNGTGNVCSEKPFFLRGTNPYTASLDAAMTLVPEGWIVELHRSFDDDGEFWSKAILIDSFSIGRGCEQQDRREVMSTGPGDLPCRIVAACLRARASTDKGEA